MIPAQIESFSIGFIGLALYLPWLLMIARNQKKRIFSGAHMPYISRKKLVGVEIINTTQTEKKVTL